MANTFPSSGPVGIGTTTPTNPLEVVGTVDVGGTVLIRNSPGQHITSLENDAGTTGAMLRFKNSSGTERVTFLYNGNVGLGETSPSNRLEVAGSIALKYATGDYTTSLRVDSGFSGAMLRFFNAAGTETMTLLYNGRVGIGNTNPEALLHVAGSTFLNGGQRVKVGAAINAMTLAESDFVVVADSTSVLTVNLPPAAASNAGRTHIIKNKNTGVVTVSGTIDGNSSGLQLSKNDAVTVMSDGSAWIII